jgi:hypothetical protein
MGKAREILQKLFRFEEGSDKQAQNPSRLYAEWTQDYSMAQERKETGREPARRPLELDSLHPRDAADFLLTSRDLTDHDRKDQATVQRLWDRETGIDR